MKKTIILISFLPLFALVFHTKEISWNKVLKQQFAYIPSGSISLGEGKTVSIQSFYISKTEVSNKEYRLFLSELKAANEMEKYNSCLPDTSKWNGKNAVFEPYERYYFSHPAYDSYPVVNVSYEAAQMYCEWLSKKINDASGGELKLSFRLPVREEFIRACKGDNEFQEYAWKGNSLRNSEGSILCNFCRLDAEDISYNDSLKKFEVVSYENRIDRTSSVAGKLDDNADVTAPVKSYWANEFGIYNLNGNVSEMIGEKGIAVGGDWRSPGYDVRNLSMKNYTSPAPTIGFRPVATVVGTDSK